MEILILDLYGKGSNVRQEEECGYIMCWVLGVTGGKMGGQNCLIFI